MAIGKYVFPSYNPDNYIYENATLYVPKGTKTLYEKTEGWNMFKNIVEGEPDPESIKGDVNGDGQVNGTDLVALTNIILGKSSQTKAADVNGDGSVNGTDYVTLVNIILGKSNARTLKRAAGATGLGIEPFDIKAGEEKDLLVNLTNPADEITLVQFDLRLPTGLSLKKADGEYDIDLARTTWKKHSLNANPQSNGTIRFLLASNTNATLTGTEGTVIKMTIKADNSFTSGDIHLENILMVTPDEKERKQETYTYHVGNEVTPTPSTTELAFEPFSIVAGGEAEVSIDLNNPADEITLVQFDLRLPAGLSLKQTDGEYDIDIAGRTTWKKHSLNANPQSNGNIRFLLASNTNATLTGTEGAIIKMTLKADNSFAGGTMKLENILLVTPNEKEVKLADYEIVVPNPNPSSYAFQKTATLENASKYLLVADIDGQLKAATPIASDKTYGYLLCIDVIEENGAINQDDLSNAFTIEATVGGYTIRQSDGRYLFQKSQYDSMNASEEPTEGQVWYVMPNNDGTFRIQNATAAKYVQYSTKYGSYGSYSTEKGIMPSLYVLKSGTSGITSFHTDKNKETSVYNLSGQKLTAPQKGINIINGKKVIVK